MSVPTTCPICRRQVKLIYQMYGNPDHRFYYEKHMTKAGFTCDNYGAVYITPAHAYPRTKMPWLTYAWRARIDHWCLRGLDWLYRKGGLG